MQAGLVVVDEHRGGDVHGVNQTQALGHAASMNEVLDLRCDVNESTPIWYFKPKMFSERLQRTDSLRKA